MITRFLKNSQGYCAAAFRSFGPFPLRSLDGSRVTLILGAAFVLSACGGSGDMDELQAYINETKAKPSGSIEGIRSFEIYEPYVYNSGAERSPFDKPVVIERRIIAKANSNVRPDETRTKDYLESFDIGALSMVGTLEWNNRDWALVKDNEGEIHRVRTGDYMGKNHGRVVRLNENSIELVEIVSNGLDGYIERPRIIELVERGGNQG